MVGRIPLLLTSEPVLKGGGEFLILLHAVACRGFRRLGELGEIIVCRVNEAVAPQVLIRSSLFGPEQTEKVMREQD